jgi:hypothetical protein
VPAPARREHQPERGADVVDLARLAEPDEGLARVAVALEAQAGRPVGGLGRDASGLAGVRLLGAEHVDEVCGEAELDSHLALLGREVRDLDILVSAVGDEAVAAHRELGLVGGHGGLDATRVIVRAPVREQLRPLAVHEQEPGREVPDVAVEVAVAFAVDDVARAAGGEERRAVDEPQRVVHGAFLTGRRVAKRFAVRGAASI